jgi:ssRNA-specific RNase YbeY (16S rRNA maturation enzyme)
MIQIKVKDQQKALNGEWQQQLQQQMHSLQDQLKPLKEVHVVVTDDGKI